jgi:predicted aconitase
MKLTDYQKGLLDGERGESVSGSMLILREIGDFWGAEELIRVRCVHMPGSSTKTARRAGRKYIKSVADEGCKFVTTTTLNPAADDLTGQFDIWVTEDTFKQQKEITESYCRMGAINCHTCTPYLVGNTPRFGDHVAWGESSAIVYANSVLGIRTNREGGPSALAAALTGFTPKYGMHLDENRKPNLHIRVEAVMSDNSDYGCMAYYVAKKYPDFLPVFSGLPQSCSGSDLKEICAALASSGSVSMFHAVGLTPEAPTEEDIKSMGLETLVIGSREVEEARTFLDRNNQVEVDCVYIGCPHLGYDEIIQLAGLLCGKKVHPDVELWLFAANSIWLTLERAGITKVLKETGAKLYSDTCPNVTLFHEVINKKSLRSGATNATKLAHYVPNWGLSTHYGSTKQCIDAAVSGRWEGK